MEGPSRILWSMENLFTTISCVGGTLECGKISSRIWPDSVTGKKKPVWFPTGLKAKGNKTQANKMLQKCFKLL